MLREASGFYQLWLSPWTQKSLSKLNLKGNQSSYYISQGEWRSFIEEAVEEALLPASLDIFEGSLNADELSDRLDSDRLFSLAENLLNLTYDYPRRELRQKIEKIL